MRVSTRKIVKPHKCILCGETLAPPAQMRYWVGIFEGDFQYHYYCLCCLDFVNEQDIDLAEGFIPGEIVEHEDYALFKQTYYETHINTIIEPVRVRSTESNNHPTGDLLGPQE